MTTEWTLASEQEEYISEAIEWTEISYTNNSHIVGLIERGSYGILSLLDEVCSISGPGSNPHSNAIMSIMSGGGGSGSSTPSLASGALSTADEAFLDRLIERFGSEQNPYVEVAVIGRAGGTITTSSVGVATGSTESGAGEGQELDMDMPPPPLQQGGENNPQASDQPTDEQQEHTPCGDGARNYSELPQKQDVNEQDKCLPQYCFR